MYPPVRVKGAQVSSDINRGEVLFVGKGNCLSCHRVADQGSYMGPDLSAIGSARTREELSKAIMTPAAQVSPQNRLYRTITVDRKVIIGRLLNQDTYLVQMLTTDALLITLKKSNLRSFDFTETSPMPSYSDKLTASEQSDLIAYLGSLHGVVKQ
jgi:putative heme-binding domain-containing protein